ncbi:hypothetical protein F8O01_12015 [Pseudoclavibacter chungangensis]|uniref:Uncharacterized protein n=1 Tax=Pseudoclavibacter chungangensis TaxID=587635 RepID=A0A7J5BPR7_9MICO|nr:hypothetical protein [Pseudoclavibacter chungangensis]KAB1655344.1 hypothetical protein F8O01_12015 [Pseudoclavibacter chungangensis]NYJ68293.1 hypothetical protein [Pseudoclavibacter chungangensis]
MYGALWRVLPGPWPVKLLIVLVLVAAILYGLVYWVFPWVDSLLEQESDVTVGMGLLGIS